VLNQYGVSVGQSIGQHFVIASTVKLLRAADSKLEFDAAAMFSYGILRVGATVRNLRQASLTTDAGNLLQLERQTRVGAAVTGSTKGEIETATASFDVDLRTTHTFWGEERRVAGGGEIWTKGRKFGFRGGLSANTVDDTTARSAGVSVAWHRGVYLEGQLTGGSDISRKGWGSGLRLTF
ncbi:MAG TPA: hypothetical protein VEU08_06315, partial [Vicinamibacterales bacterium]|nr:hypothetical protein [Vicinamibacterales bacterium]